ncbi:hypothetical protein Harman_40140 [Haloarcula mannanilytica]|uniref:CRISPR-associated protein Csh1 n=1 Tax=Haloarcula mannanilytica TaxID=2509225 RepID=A0A4C2EV52_9EURY|nr:TM1802 family CRISPR-associated protein [Haloarcula mannanilytica]GCF16079.1 hypothetical protein Harman_40140 [Haloarcula mannanilytica]
MADNDYAETAVKRFQPRLPASLYEVAWQYSLYDWYSAVQSGDIDWELAPEHLAYLTPGAKSELFGADDSLITVYADLSDPENPQLRPDSDGGPVEIGTYTRGDRFRVGHAYPANKTSSMTDYSITTHKGADAHHIAGFRDDAWGTNNVQDRFTAWAQSEYAETVREQASEADASLLDGLATLGDDDEQMQALGEAFVELAGGEDEEFDSLITVKVKDPEADEYRYPGEIPVLNDVMVEKKSARLESISVEDASGDGVGYVTGNNEQVTGGSPGLFGMYGKKQREHFPDIDTKGSDAWRTRPLSFDTAAAVAAADSIFEDFFRGLGNNRRLYVLPYLAMRRDELDTDTFEWFYDTIYTALRDAETGPDGTFDTELETLVREVTDGAAADGETDFDDLVDEDHWDRVRFAIVLQVTGNPDRVYFDTLDGIFQPAALEDAHNDVTRSAIFEGDGIFGTYPSPESSPYLGLGLPLVRRILYGDYFGRTTEPTRTSRQASETPSVGEIDDHEMRRVRALLTEGKIPLQPLLEEYIHQLVQDQNESFDSDSDYTAFPQRSVVEQYTQLRALSDADMLESTNTTFTFTTSAMTDEPDSRTDRLESFLDNHDALDADHTRAVFLLGGLVGRITAFQSRENVSSTLVRRYPIDYLTKQTVKEVTKEVLQMDHSYAEAEEDRSYWTNNRYTSRLTDAMLSADPNEWTMSDAELQWLYSLGISYGLNDTRVAQADDHADAAAADD